MMHNYTFSVMLRTENHLCFESHFKISTLDAYIPIAPIDRCSDPRSAALFGGKTHTQALYIDARRKSFCDEVAKMLSDELFNNIKKQDTINGHPQ